jgi:dolichol-phosphate hexosyltransferase
VSKRKRVIHSIQVFIAALNEEEGIGLTIADLKEHLHNSQIMVVDGNSFDRTAEVAETMGAEVVFQDGLGKGDAIAKAIKCSDLTTDYVAITDADYTYPAEYIPEMISILDEMPEVGMVCGNRFNGNVDPEALRNMFYFGNQLISYAYNVLNGVHLEDPLTGLRVVRSEILKDWKVKSKGFDIEVELNHQVERKGFSIIEIPIQYRRRIGQKKLKARHGATILKRIILEATY